MTQRTAIIIGAGPAGLTAALELLRRSGKATDGGKTPEGQLVATSIAGRFARTQ